jgi:hypothetical protein
MITRSNTSMEKTIKRGTKLSRAKQFHLARKVLANAGACLATIERVLYEPHNIRNTD